MTTWANNVNPEGGNPNVVLVDQLVPNVINVEELKNIVTVNEDAPNEVIVTMAGTPNRVERTQWLSGEGDPTTVSPESNVGDYYIDLLTGDFYGPKTSSGWPAEPFFTAVTTITQQNERYVHTQIAPVTTWNITHPLGGRPSIMVVDSAGTVVIGEVLYISDTQLQVLFTAPFSGFAYLT